MKVILTNKFYFIVDQDSYNLYSVPERKEETLESKTPEEIANMNDYIEGFFTSIPRMINRVTQRILADDKSEVDLEGFLSRFEALQNELIGILPSTLKDNI